MRLQRLVLVVVPLAAVGALFFACNGRNLDLGDNADASTASKNETSEAEGDDETWSGYIENYTFPSGSDSLVLTLTREADGGVSGHARFGSAPLYPPPTDPHVGYPVAAVDAGPEPDSLEGFRYTLSDGSFDGTRLRATVNSGELYARWCALQTPEAFALEQDGAADYWCLPEGGLEYDSMGYCFSVYGKGEATQIDCAWALLCSAQVCSCTPSGCTPSTANKLTSFDFRIEGTLATGSVEPYGAGPYNIHLTQQ